MQTLDLNQTSLVSGGGAPVDAIDVASIMLGMCLGTKATWLICSGTSWAMILPQTAVVAAGMFVGYEVGQYAKSWTS